MPGSRLSRISIRLRLTAWYAVVLMLGLALFGLVMWLAAEHRLMAGVDARLAQRVTGLKMALESESWITNRDRLQRELSEYASENADLSLVQLRNGGDTFLLPSPQTTPFLPESMGAVGPRTVARDGKRYRIAGSSLVAAGERWEVLVAISLEDVLALMRNLLRLLLLMVPAVVGIACLGGYWLSLRALRPVDEITAVAKSIGLQNLSQRIVVPQTGDELQRMAETWNEVLSRLESSVKRMRQFTADASHELRTPLALIRASAELALRREREPGAYRKTLHGIEEQAEYMTKLTESLLTLARADSGSLGLALQPLDLNPLVASVVRQNEALAVAKQIQLKAETTNGAVLVEANDAALRRLLLILLDNALKFTPGGGTVTATVEPTPRGARVSVSDTGPGIAPDALPFIFDRFYRGDPARENGAGFGLGLSIAQVIAEAHESKIAVSSAAGAGSRFWLELKI
jgi:two-component system, OmpR family, heavy metal sensor histidine kinase CusS